MDDGRMELKRLQCLVKIRKRLGEGRVTWQASEGMKGVYI